MILYDRHIKRNWTVIVPVPFWPLDHFGEVPQKKNYFLAAIYFRDLPLLLVA